jgi:hypothetical protein
VLQLSQQAPTDVAPLDLGQNTPSDRETGGGTKAGTDTKVPEPGPAGLIAGALLALAAKLYH